MLSLWNNCLNLIGDNAGLVITSKSYLFNVSPFQHIPYKLFQRWFKSVALAESNPPSITPQNLTTVKKNNAVLNTKTRDLKDEALERAFETPI